MELSTLTTQHSILKEENVALESNVQSFTMKMRSLEEQAREALVLSTKLSVKEAEYQKLMEQLHVEEEARKSIDRELLSIKRLQQAAESDRDRLEQQLNELRISTTKQVETMQTEISTLMRKLGSAEEAGSGSDEIIRSDSVQGF